MAPELVRIETTFRATKKQDVVTMLGSLWIICGIFLDGYAHNNLTVESFFTPWHAVFYGGFTATALWVLHVTQAHRMVLQARSIAEIRRIKVQSGYGLALIGMVIFSIAGACDFVWHSLLGIEKDIPALLSPPHLALATGGFLIATAPWRSAWHSDEPALQTSLRQFLPTLMSLALAAAIFSFFFQYVSAFTDDRTTTHFHNYLLQHHFEKHGFYTDYVASQQLAGLMSIFCSNIILMAPMLLSLRRFRAPFGAMMVLFVTISTLAAGILVFQEWTAPIAALIAGLTADLLIRRTKPKPSSPKTYWLIGFVTPLVWWSTHFLLLWAFQGVDWPPTLWGGSIIMSAFIGLGLAFLVAPPRIAIDRWGPDSNVA